MINNQINQRDQENATREEEKRSGIKKMLCVSLVIGISVVIGAVGGAVGGLAVTRGKSSATTTNIQQMTTETSTFDSLTTS